MTRILSGYACLLLGLTVAAAQESTGSVDLLRLQARQTTQHALELYRGEEYREAVDEYLAAIQGWQRLLNRSPQDADAHRQLSICEHNLVFCLFRPAEVEAEAARTALEQGDAEGAYRHFMAAAASCEWASARRAEEALETNRIAYINKAGLVLVRNADRLSVEGLRETSVLWYERAARHFRALSDRHPDVTAFQRNLDYIELKRLQIRFLTRGQQTTLTSDDRLVSFAGEDVTVVDSLRTTIVFCWARTIPGSCERLEQLDRWMQEHQDESIRLVAICFDRAPGWGQGLDDEAAQWATDSIQTTCVWADSDWIDVMGIPQSLPTLWLVNEEGQIDADPALGLLTLEQLRDRIDARR